MLNFINGNLWTETKEAAEDTFQMLNFMCYVFHPEIEPTRPKFTGKYYHVYLRKKRANKRGKTDVWMAEEARNNGEIKHPLPPLAENSRKRLECYLSGCYDNLTKQ